MGNVREHSVEENIRLGLGQLQRVPNEYCRTCPGATLAINQTVEQRLRQAIQEWLNPGTAGEAAEAPPGTPPVVGSRPLRGHPTT